MKSEWKRVRIADVADVRRGASPRPIHNFLSDEGMPWVKIADATSKNSRYIAKTKEFIKESGVSASVVVVPETLILSNSATPGLPRIMKIQACVHDGWLVFGNYRNVERDFLYYLLTYVRPNLIGLANGSVFQNLKTDIVNRFEISLPPLSYQRKVAAILSSLDDKIENNNAICKNLEDQALICFCQTFIESASYKASRPIYEFAEFINGSSFRQSELTHEGLPIIKIGELKAGISATTLRYSGDISKKVLINDGDILFSWSGNPQTSIDVFIWCGGSGVLNQHIFKVKSLFDCPWFTYLLLKYLMPQFVSIASDKQTTGLGHVTAGDLKRLKFPHDLGKMQSFESTIAPIMLGVYNSMLENVKLLSLRDTLLPKLMRGEIDI